MLTKLAVLIDVGKGEPVERILRSLEEFREHRNLEFMELWVGDTHDIGPGARKMLKRVKAMDMGVPLTLFAGNPLQVSRSPDKLMNPNVINTSKTMFRILLKSGKLYYWFFKKFCSLFSLSQPEDVRYGYYVLHSDSSIGRKVGALTLPDDDAMALIKKKWKKYWKAFYIEAGSGSKVPVSDKIELLKKIRELTREKNLVMIVGGGLRKTEHIRFLVDLDVDIIVVSTVLEESEEPGKIIEEFLNIVASSK
ncbi:MAG: geranylgeranylglyceryl/heptaprenylglyceryl phosphate synthase [Candidatus Odinarchaeota archaeon]